MALWHFTPLSVLGYLAVVLIQAAWWGLLGWCVVSSWTHLPRVPRWLVFAANWTAVEWALGHTGDLAFPWLGLGTSLTGYPLLIQWADLAGARGITFWLAGLSVPLAHILLHPRRHQRELLAVLATVLAALGYGLYRVATLETRFLGGIALIQPATPYSEKWEPGRQDSIVSGLNAQTRETMARIQPNLMIWPEAALPGDLTDHPDWTDSLTLLSDWAKAPLLTGGLDVVPRGQGGRDQYNAAFLFDEKNGWTHQPVYHKRHLVPIVERAPLVPAAWRASHPYFGGFSPGSEEPVYQAGMGRFGVLICYESTFEGMSRAYRRAGAEFLVNMTNDDWYGRTTAPSQHAAHLVMRAIETRMGIARAANSGISEFVSPLGIPKAQTRPGEKITVVAGFLTSDVIPPYVRLGDWVGLLSVVLTGGMLAVLLIRRK